MFKPLKLLLSISVLLIFSNCSSQTKMRGTASSDPIAFPGAEGFGKFTTGGRGGKLYVVSNLNDDGPGSLRKAAEASGKRMIVFTTAGTIHLKTRLSIKGDVTIAGQTAPGDGICLADQPVSLSGNNIIMRYLRIRMGDRYQAGGMVDGAGADDALSGTRRKNIIIDHCSLSWSTDEVFSVYAGDSTTLQWNLISEPLNYSYHFEAGDKDYEHHGYGGIWGGAHLTAHHNLFAHCNSRTARFDGIRNAATELVDYSNNVIYNWGGNNVYAGEGGNYNIVNNYYKYGPQTNKTVKFQVVNPNNKLPQIPFGKFYVKGNHVDGSPEVTANNYLGVRMGNGGTEQDKQATVINAPHPTVLYAMQHATQAYEAVLRNVGASFRRDTLDARVINDVKNRTGKFIDVQGGFAHGTAYDLTVNAWPALKSANALTDTDQDGIPDEFEKKNRLDASNASDAAQQAPGSHYTNLEIYINSILK